MNPRTPDSWIERDIDDPDDPYNEQEREPDDLEIELEMEKHRENDKGAI